MEMLACFAALLLLCSISLLSLDLMELAQIYFFLLLRRQERLEVYVFSWPELFFF